MSDELDPYARVDQQLQSHERALFGYVDNVAVKYIPGLLQRMDDHREDIALLKAEVAKISETTRDLPEMTATVKWAAKWGKWVIGVILISSILSNFHQFGLVTEILKSVGLPH